MFSSSQTYKNMELPENDPYTPEEPIVINGVFKEQIESFFDTYDPAILKQSLEMMFTGYLESESFCKVLPSIRGETALMFFDFINTLRTYEVVRVKPL
jgi:hypothetical protein